MLQTKTAIILAGGRGTRLGELTKDAPKPLLPVAGRPFIFHLLDYLKAQGIKKVILSVGYLGHQFEGLLGKRYQELSLEYSIETTPLGTGGALAQALTMTNEENAFALNGDTLFCADLKKLEEVHEWQQAAVSIILRYVEDTNRYGCIEFEQEHVTQIHEKGIAGPGYINGGIYLFRKNQWPRSGFQNQKDYSLEKQVFPWFLRHRTIAYVASNNDFIDIGTINDFNRGQVMLACSSCL